MVAIPRASTILLLVAVALAAAAAPPPLAAMTYYVSRSTGDDRNDGRAARREGVQGPWKSLARASAAKYRAGDQLLLECGGVWDETLTVAGDGTADNPVVVASYGAGERPYIRRTPGNHTVCLVIDRSSGYRIRDLELGFAQNAIRVVLDARANRAYGSYSFEECFFHDISNPTYPDPDKGEGYQHNDLRNMGWTIFVDALDSPEGVSMTGLTVRHCVALRAQGFYIPMGPIRQQGVKLDGNTLTHNSYNSVYQTGNHFDITNSAFVYGYPWEFHPMGATQVLAGGLRGVENQRNEVTGNEFGWAGDYPNCPDGCGYDFEGATADVTFQNNFVHSSYGEAVLFMGGFEHKNLLFDGNIFRNNERFSSRWPFDVTLAASNKGNGTFSNNKFFLRPGKRAFNAKPDCFTYTNNDENAAGTFVAMPLVTRISYAKGARVYALASATPGATIRYTTDASLPTEASPAYSRPIAIRRSGVLNAKAFKKGCYPSYVNALAVELRGPEGRPPSVWWKLDEASGSVVRDSAGRSTGRLAGATWTAGKIGNGLGLNGRNASVALDSSRLAAVSDTFTVSFWAKPAAQRASTLEVESGAGLTGAAWWKLDEAAGSALADSTGGNPGMLRGCTRTDGKFGCGLRFNGASDSVALHNAGLAAVTDTFTIAFWAEAEAARASTPEANAGISGTSGQRYALAPAQYSAGSGGAGVGVSLGTNGVSVFELADNYLPSPLVADRALSGWNHLVVIYRERQPSLYVNGVLERTGVKSNKSVHPAFTLGGGVHGWYQGKLDDVRVYPRALTDAEVRKLATQGEAPPIPWTLDKAAGTKGLPYALGPANRGGGSDGGHAGMGVSVGTNGISVCESSDDYLPSLLVDNCALSGWNHVAVVYRNKQPTLYLNGVYEKAGCRSKKAVHPVFNLGGGGGLGWYDGMLDDVRVYDRSLTDAEIQELAAGSGNR